MTVHDFVATALMCGTILLLLGTIWLIDKMG
jgi:hypothetical protein